MVAVAAAPVGVRQGVVAVGTAWVTHLDVDAFTIRSFDVDDGLDRRLDGRQDLQVVGGGSSGGGGGGGGW